MADFEIHIKTTADLKAVQDLKGALQHQITAAKALGQDAAGLASRLKTVDAALGSSAAHAVRLAEGKQRAANAAKILGLESGKLNSALGQISSVIPGFQKLSGLFESLAGSATGPLAAGLAGLAAAFAVAGKSITEFAQAEREIAQLDAALAQTGQLTDAYREQLQALSGTLQEVSGIADDKWLGVLRRLTQFGSTAETIERDAEAVKNLAGILGGDLPQAATLVSKAVQGSFDQFSRFGIVLDETASKAEKLEQLFRELALRGGGQLEAASRTLTGQFGRLTNAVSDFFEAIGGLISRSGTLQTVMRLLTTAFAFWAEKLSSTVPKVEGLNNAAKRTQEILEANEAAAKQYAQRTKEIADASDAAAAAMNRELEAARRVARQQDEITEAKLAERLAQIDADETSGRLTPDAAIRARSQARRGAEAEKFTREQTRLKQEVEIKQRAISGNVAQVAEVEAEAQAAEAAVTSDQEIEARRAVVAEKGQKNIEFFQQQYRAFLEDPASFTTEHRRALGLSTNFDLTATGVGKTGLALSRKIVRAEAEAASDLRVFDLSPENQTGPAKEAATQKRETALEMLRKKTEENNRLTEEIERLESELKNREAVRQIRTRAEDITTRTDIRKAEEKARPTAALESSSSAEAVAATVQSAAEQSVGQIEALSPVLAGGFQQIAGSMLNLQRQVSAEVARLESVTANLRLS